MEIEDFREKVRRAFGEDLHRASPATVRDFLDDLHQNVPLTERNDRRIEIKESAKSYEEVMRTFFARMLETPESQAVPMLWAVAFDLCYALIETHDADKIGHLFRGLEESAP